MQTSINKAGQPVGVAGQLSDNAEGVDIVSRFSQEASAVIPFGVGVKKGTSTHGVVNLTANNDIVEGISVWGFNHLPGSLGDLDQVNNGLKPKAGLQIMRRGRLYVVVDAGLSSVTPYTDRCFVRWQSDGAGNTLVGAFSNAQDGGSRLIDITKLAQFVGPIFTAADGTTKIAEIEATFTVKA